MHKQKPAGNTETVDGVEASHVPVFSIAQGDRGQYRLQVRGSFTPGWLARLSAGLSDHQVSIRHGAGKRIRAAQWEAEFEIEMPPQGGDPHDLDYLSFIENSAEGHRDEELQLTDYSFRQADDDRHAVWVEVEGTDKLGFLRNVLKSFAFYSLFPSEMSLETEGSKVRDRFLLRGIAGTAPSENALQGVRELLDSFLLR